MSNSNLSGRFKQPKIQWTKDEYLYTLAYYYFIYQNNTRIPDLQIFTNHLNSLSKTNRGYNSIKIRFSNYDAVNPIKKSTGFQNTGKECQRIWTECINQDGTPKEAFIKSFMNFIFTYGENNKIYSSFVQNPEYKKYSYDYKRPLDLDEEDELITTDDVNSFESFDKPIYKSEPKTNLTVISTKKYKRDIQKAKKAIFNSNYKCSINPEHKTFISKNGKQYMEAHHLIPIGAQEEFKNSLDVDANIVSLCPLCHRKLHHGEDIDEDLKKLFERRKSLLEKSGIEITFDKLKQYYK